MQTTLPPHHFLDEIAPASALLITCEHATNAIPARWAHLFASPAAQSALHSHRGWDPGAAELAADLLPPISVLRPPTSDLRHRTSLPPPSPLAPFFGTASRLLIDLNRSENNPQLWSEFTRDLPPDEKQAIIRDIYAPFRRATREAIDDLLASGRRPVLHLSLHSFTPVLDGDVREAEIGLLYDPARPLEVHWGNAWAAALTSCAPEWRIRHNYPYLGIDDGFVTQLRTQYSPAVYAGIELEVNQALATDPALRPMLCTRLRHSLAQALDNWPIP